MLVVATPQRVGQVLRPGGRIIGWSEWGPVDGTPVVFCTGAAMTSSLGFASDVVDDLGIRLVCVDRAGLGRSSPHAEKSFLSYRDDVEAVLRDLAIERAGVVAYSQGAPFALALSALANRIALVAGQDELSHPQRRALLRPEILELVTAIGADPDGFASSMATRVDAVGMVQLVMAMSSQHDRGLFSAEPFHGAYVASVSDAFAQGPQGYIRDLVLAMLPWDIAPETVEVPVDLWYGLLDTSPVHSPDFGLQLSTRFPNARLHQLADEGSSLLWTRAREILTSLVRS